MNFVIEAEYAGIGGISGYKLEVSLEGVRVGDVVEAITANELLDAIPVNEIIDFLETQGYEVNE